MTPAWMLCLACNTPAMPEGPDVILPSVSFLNVTLYACPSRNGWADMRGSVEDGRRRFSSSTAERPSIPRPSLSKSIRMAATD